MPLLMQLFICNITLLSLAKKEKKTTTTVIFTIFFFISVSIVIPFSICPKSLDKPGVPFHIHVIISHCYLKNCSYQRDQSALHASWVEFQIFQDDNLTHSFYVRVQNRQLRLSFSRIWKVQDSFWWPFCGKTIHSKIHRSTGA